ncbi:FMN-binding protein [Streptomyces sp. Tue6028]|uniref:FMN-binding protein n=1 Tax=Streptomyces sp. Tue6028 TaxID=2036037 RepID=UPI003D71B742
MKRAVSAVVLTVAGLVPLWRYEPGGGATAGEAAGPVPSSSAPSSSTAPSSSSSSSGGATRVVRGSVVDTEKGAVQVEVTFRGDRISAVRMLRRPNHPQTAAAVPKLIEETLQEQSADIDTVTGATVTSEGYVHSLQAALDARGA